MPTTANPYMYNPEMANISSNLATAIFGDPEARMKRDYYASEVTKNNAAAGKTNLEADYQRTKNQAFDAVPDTVAGLFTPRAGEIIADRQARVAPLLGRMVQAGGGNAQELAGGLKSTLSSLFALGDDNDMTRSLVLDGKMPGKEFAPSVARADTVANRDAGNDRATKFGVARIDQAGALARTNAEQEGALARLFATPLNVAAGHDAYLAPKDPRRTAAGPDGVIHGSPTYETVRGRAGADILDIPDGQPVPSTIASVFAGGSSFKPGAKAPALVTGRNIEDAVLQAARTVPGAILDANGRQMVNPAFEASFDPSTVRKARAAAGDTFQKTRNANAAGNAYLAALGVAPGSTFSEPGIIGQVFGARAGVAAPAGDPAPSATVTHPDQLPPPAQRQIGMRINSPRGMAEWNGHGWVPVEN